MSGVAIDQIEDGPHYMPLAGLDEFAGLFEEEGIADTYFQARLLRMAHEVCRRAPDLGNAVDFAQQSLDGFAISEGADGDAASELQRWLAERGRKEH